jgi:hypothetical protein
MLDTIKAAIRVQETLQKEFKEECLVRINQIQAPETYRKYSVIIVHLVEEEDKS